MDDLRRFITELTGVTEWLGEVDPQAGPEHILLARGLLVRYAESRGYNLKSLTPERVRKLAPRIHSRYQLWIALARQLKWTASELVSDPAARGEVDSWAAEFETAILPQRLHAAVKDRRLLDERLKSLRKWKRRPDRALQRDLRGRLRQHGSDDPAGDCERLLQRAAPARLKT